MDKYGKLVYNSSLFFIANFGSKILTFIFVRFYTEYLSTSEYGILDIINNSVSLIVPIITLCITEAVLRFSIDEVERRSKIYSLGIEVVGVSCLLLLALIPVLRYFSSVSDYYIYIYCLTVSNSLFTLTAHFVRGIGKTKEFAISGFLHTILQIGLNIVFLAVFSLGIKGYILASFMANIFALAYVFVSCSIKTYLTFSCDFLYLRKMIAYSVPLIPNTLFWWIMQSSDRYAVNYFLTASANGIYAASNKIPTIIVTLSTLFTQAWQISSVEESTSSDKKNYYSKVFNTLAMIVIVSSSLIIAVLPYFYKLFVNDSYYSGWTCVPALLLGMVFSCFSSFLGTNYVVMKKTRGAFYTTAVGAFINIGLNIVLTPKWGIIGTAFATTISFFLTWIIRIIDTNSFVSISYNTISFIIPLLLLFVQVLLSSCNEHYLLIQLGLLLIILLLESKTIIVFSKRIFQILLSFVRSS